jgi:glycerol-3-phosphate dehydrogenase
VTAAQSQIAQDLGLSLRQVSAVWELCGTRTAWMLAPTTDTAGAADDRRNLSGTDLPVRFVRRVLQDEWCCHLTDLVERRLMLLYHPELSRACLQDLTALMIEQGLLNAHDAPAEREHCITRLRAHFGREVNA